MVIDSHEHIMFPVKMQLDKMDAAGVDKTVLFCTAPHPENAGTLKELEEEMAAVNKILAGANSKEDNIRRLKKNISEVAEAVKEYPERFLGFGSVPLGMGLEETEEWIDTQITSNSLYGIGGVYARKRAADHAARHCISGIDGYKDLSGLGTYFPSGHDGRDKTSDVLM